MDEKAKQARREYARQYREKNRERIREKTKEWVQNNPDKVKQQRKRWSQANPDKIRKYKENYWNKKAQEMEEQAGNVCLNCGQSFEPKRADAKYCTTNCRVAYNRKLNRNK